jgi:hypothetical protein
MGRQAKRLNARQQDSVQCCFGRETTRTLPSIHAAIRLGRGRLRLEFCEASISRVAHGSGARWWCRACR